MTSNSTRSAPALAAACKAGSVFSTPPWMKPRCANTSVSSLLTNLTMVLWFSTAVTPRATTTRPAVKPHKIFWRRALTSEGSEYETVAVAGR